MSNCLSESVIQPMCMSLYHGCIKDTQPGPRGCFIKPHNTKVLNGINKILCFAVLLFVEPYQVNKRID